MAFEIFLITDTHLFENSLGAEGPAYERRSRTDQKCVAETGAILKEAFKDIGNDTSVDTVIIPGDLVYRGEYESHVSFRKMLEELKAKGKKIYVLTAPHDYGTAGDDYDSGACGFIGEETVPVEKMPREKLREFYWDYGFSQAISEDEKTMSYVAALNDKIRVMAINVDGNCHDTKGTISDEQMVWIKEQIKDAKDNGCYIFAMMHYPLLPGSPIMNIIGDAKIKEWQKRADELADAGLDLIFTGHMHMQSYNEYTSPAGNKITDICTGSIAGCPSFYRKIKFNDNGVINVSSLKINDFDWDKQGKTADEYFQWRFDRMITDAVDGMAYDFPKFARFFGGEEKVKALKPIVTVIGRILQKLTVSGIGKMFFFKVDDSVKDILVKDIAVEFVRNIFTGDEPYTPDTAIYDVMNKLLSRLHPILGVVEKKLGEKNPLFADLKGFVLSLIGDEVKKDNACDVKVNYNFEV